jgi:hypothetical protein
MQNNLYFQDYSGGYSNYTPPPPPPPPPVPGYHQQGFRSPNTDPNASTNSILALIFGILGYVVCPFVCGIIAWIMGSAELNKIKRGESSQAGRGFATAGMWLGIVNVILIGLIILAYVVFFVILIGLSTTTR